MNSDKPIIGIISRSKYKYYSLEQTIPDTYRSAVVKSGGIPISILSTQKILYDNTRPSKIPRLTQEEKKDLLTTLKLCKGIILAGGDSWYEYDEFACRYALDNKIPVLGICLGIQLMNAVNTRISPKEFSHHQKIESNINHKQKGVKNAHEVIIDKNSRLYKIIEREKIMVNSNHIYSIVKTNNFKVSAKSIDGIIEAIELPDHPFAFGFQWHPEKIFDDNDISKNIFAEFISTAETNNQKIKVKSLRY